MKEIVLSVAKKEVYKEIMRTTAYTAVKAAAGDEVSTVDEDDEMLERYWQESRVAFCSQLKYQLKWESEADGVFEATLSLNNSFDDKLTASMQTELFSFFVANILAGWLSLADRKEAASYAQQAVGFLTSIHRKALYIGPPKAPVITDI